MSDLVGDWCEEFHLPLVDGVYVVHRSLSDPVGWYGYKDMGEALDVGPFETAAEAIVEAERMLKRRGYEIRGKA